MGQFGYGSRGLRMSELIARVYKSNLPSTSDRSTNGHFDNERLIPYMLFHACAEDMLVFWRWRFDYRESPC